MDTMASPDLRKRPMNLSTSSVNYSVSDAGSEFESRRKIKTGKPTEATLALFEEYTNDSTIHGVKYLGDRKRPCLERLWWVGIFIISLYLCADLIIKVYEKWENNPVIVSFAEKSTPTWDIPFPAVTICPETKALKNKIDFTKLFVYTRDNNSDFTDENYAFDQTQRNSMIALAQICEPHLSDGFHFGQNFTDEEFILGTLQELAPPFTDLISFCKWRNELLPNVTEVFSPIWTDEGICYSFNSLTAEEMFSEDNAQKEFNFIGHNRTSEHWTLEDGYKPDAPVDPYPYRVISAGARAGLFSVFNMMSKDTDYLCRGPVQGFKILLHTPGEMPQISKDYIRIPLDQEILIAIKPNMITTSAGLHGYDPNTRQCFFNTERNLRYFKIYTQRNCEIECLSNYTLKTCGCVKFSMPRTQDIKICGASKISCYDAAEDSLLTNALQSAVKGEDPKDGCNCLPSCTSITYNAEISQADFEWKKLLQSFGEYNATEMDIWNMARLSIFFKENQFITSKRSELYGLTDFLAASGGLLGLFMGVSLLSLVEIFYHCTVRLFCNLKMRHDKQQKLKKRKPEIQVGPTIKA